MYKLMLPYICIYLFKRYKIYFILLVFLLLDLLISETLQIPLEHLNQDQSLQKHL
ncbi:hypothetical protein Mapa_018496 [Marchantia paleacea]|nr:hypothetical protein Mapa_018496 [Marchantia paleacea]